MLSVILKYFQSMTEWVTDTNYTSLLAKGDLFAQLVECLTLDQMVFGCFGLEIYLFNPSANYLDLSKVQVKFLKKLVKD